VTPVQEEDIKKLTGSGGSDWHLAYICLYGAKRMSDHLDAWQKEDQAKADKAAEKLQN